MSDERLGRIELEAGHVNLAMKCDEMRIVLPAMADELAAMNERIDSGFARLEAMMQSLINARRGINGDLSADNATHKRRIQALGRRKRP